MSDRKQRPESLSILVPTYNEAATLEEALRRLWDVSLPIPCEVIVVDDGSRDGSAEIVEGLVAGSPWPLRLIRHQRNQGKTAALRTGLAQVTGTLVLVYDADLEYDPQDIPTLLAPILEGKADAVYGSRFQSPERRVLFFWHALGNRLVTGFANLFANLNLTDMETCFKLVRTGLLKDMRLRSERFGYEPEVTVKLGRMGARVYEVPIRYSGRSYDEGKKIHWWDAVRAAGTILRAGLLESPVAEPEARSRFARSRLGAYYDELLGRLDPDLEDSLLVVDAGAGGLPSALMRMRRLILCDPSDEQVRRIDSLFSHRPNVGVHRWDPAEGPLPSEIHTPGALLWFHGLDRREEDAEALRQAAGAVRPGGRVFLLLPAYASLGGPMDAGLGRRRRYDRKGVRRVLEEAGLEPVSVRPANAIGAFLWWFAGPLMRARTLRPFHARLFRLLLPFVRLERYLGVPFGLSWLIEARRP